MGWKFIGGVAMPGGAGGWAARKIAVTGDSISYGMDDVPYPRSLGEIISNELGCVLQNDIAYPSEAIAAQTIRWNAISAADKLKLDFVINVNGNNNLPQGSAATITAYQNYLNLIRSEIKSSCKIIICSLTPNDYWPYEGDGPLIRREFNEAIRGEGATPITGANAVVTEFTGSLADTDYGLLVAYQVGGADPIHPNKSGRELMADAIIPYMRNINLARQQVPSAPHGLVCTAISEAVIDLSWDHSGTNVNLFRVERSLNGLTGWSDISGTLKAVKTYTNSGLSASTEYFYRIRAYNGAGYSAYSDVESATTLSPSYPAVLEDGNTVGWYLYEDTPNITESGGRVSEWKDYLGSGHDLTASGDQRPTLNGNGILFDGVNITGNCMKTGAFTYNQPATIYLVMKQVTWESFKYIIDGLSATSVILFQYGGEPNLQLFAGAITCLNGDLSVGSYGVVECVFNGASSELMVDGGTPGTGDIGANNFGGITVGARGDGALAQSNIEVKEMIFRKIADTSGNREDIRDYLTNKYGL